MSKVEQILQDLANGVVDETLPWLTEDVAFDMDEVVVEDEETVDDDEDESDIGIGLCFILLLHGRLCPSVPVRLLIFFILIVMSCAQLTIVCPFLTFSFFHVKRAYS